MHFLDILEIFNLGMSQISSSLLQKLGICNISFHEQRALWHCCLCGRRNQNFELFDKKLVSLGFSGF